MAETLTDPAAGAGSALRLVLNSDLQVLLGCVVCGGTLSEPVFFGGCLHSACRKCFDGLRGTGPASGRDGDATDAGRSSSDGDAADASCGSTAGDNSSSGGSDSSNSDSSSNCVDREPSNGSTGGGSGDVATAEANAAGQHTGDTTVPCPACGVAPLQATACGGQKANIFVAALQRAKAIACGGEAPCDFCPNDKDATPQRADRWCAECNKCICSQCTGWHSKFNKDHVTKALAAPGSSDGGMRCDTCLEGGESRRATRWCPDCANALCDSCAQWHDRFQRTHRTHLLAAGDVIVNQGLLIAPPCRQHGARSEMYCRSCDGLCCADCAKSCLEASHDVYVIYGTRTKEYVERARSDLKAAESSLSDRAAALAPPRPSSDDGTTSAADGDDDDDDTEQAAAKALQSAMAADWATLSSSRQRAVEAVGRAFDELEGRVKSHYETLRRSLLLPDEQQQQQSRGTSGVRTAKSVLRDAVGHGLLYSRMLLQLADTSIVLDQHASVLAGLRALLDRADRATNLLPALEQLKPIVQALDAASIDSLVTMHFTRLVLPSPGSDQKSLLLSHTSRASNSSASDGAAAAVTSSRPEPNDGAAARSNEPVGDSAVVDDSEDNDGIGVGDAILQITTDGNLRDVAITDNGCVLLADAGKGLRQFNSAGKKLATWHAPKGGGDRSKAGVVSTVCMLDDGRVAVGVISSGCIILLRSAPTTGSSGGGGSEPASDVGRWIEDGQIKLDGGPYHVAARRDALAVALARSDEHKVDLGGVSAVVGSNWGPGPRVDVVSLGSDPRRKYDVGYQVVAVLLTDKAVVVSSDDKVKTGAGGGRASYVIDAYERLPPSAGAAPDGGHGQLLWRYECDEHAHDLCAPSASSSVIYVALPHSRRIVAIDGASGTWLVDVFSGGAAAPATALGKPLRLAVARSRRKASGADTGRAFRPLLAVMYNGAAVAVTLHPVGSGGTDD